MQILCKPSDLTPSVRLREVALLLARAVLMSRKRVFPRVYDPEKRLEARGDDFDILRTVRPSAAKRAPRGRGISVASTAGF